MDFQDIQFKPKEFKAFTKTYIDQSIEKVKINIPEENIDYGTFNLDSLYDVEQNQYLLKTAKINNQISYDFKFNLDNPQNDNVHLNMNAIIDCLEPLEYKGIRMNYNGNIYDRKSQLTKIDSLPKISYQKDKFSL